MKPVPKCLAPSTRACSSGEFEMKPAWAFSFGVTELQIAIINRYSCSSEAVVFESRCTKFCSTKSLVSSEQITSSSLTNPLIYLIDVGKKLEETIEVERSLFGKDLMRLFKIGKLERIAIVISRTTGF